MQDIEAKFSQAGLNLILEPHPLLVDNAVIYNWGFQMAICRNKYNGGETPNEFFQVFMLSQDNLIQVLEANRKRKQVLLLVKDPARKYLCGKDESHLFIAELKTQKRIKSIDDAYRALMPTPVQTAYHQHEHVIRQGEWFFIPVNPTERRLIELIALGIRREGVEGKLNGRLNPEGNPHKVEKLLRYKAPSSRRWIGEEFVFARGNVWHGEHKTIYLDEWHRVIHNAEQVCPKWTD